MKNRTLSILKKFIYNAYPQDIDKLSKEYSIGKRSIRNEINLINKYLKNKNFCTIKNIRKKGYVLEMSSDQKVELINILHQPNEEYLNYDLRVFDLILALSLSEKEVFLTKKEEELMISKSTIEEDIRKVRKKLKHYNIEVCSIPKKGMVLVGQESAIRTMLFETINNNVGFFIDDLSRYDIKSLAEKILYKYISEKMYKNLNSIYDKTISSIDNIYKSQLILFASIWLMRCQHRNYIEEEIFDKDKYQSQSEITNFISKITFYYKLNVSYDEINYINFMLSTFKQRDINDSIEWAQAQMLSIQLVKYVENKTKIPFSKYEKNLYPGLYKHMVGLINRMKSNLQVLNPLKDSIKEEYKVFYDTIKDFSLVIQNSIGKKISDDEIAFLTIYFSTSFLAIGKRYEYVYKACVVCNQGSIIGKLLIGMLNEYFSVKIVATISPNELFLIDKLDVDLIFTTTDINFKDKPVLMVNPIMTKENQKLISDFLKANKDKKQVVCLEKDYTNFFNNILEIIQYSGGKITSQVYGSLEEQFYNNGIKINKREVQPMLKDLLTENNILLKQKCENWEQAIETVAKPLLEDRTIESTYVSTMINNVKTYGPYIVIGKHLALAHASSTKGVNKLGISVMTLAKPVIFGNELNDPVSIIFCLAAVDSYSHLNIMKSLVELINDEEKIDKLIDSSSVKEFERILYYKDNQKEDGK